MLRADYRTHMLIGFEDKKYRVLDVGERVLVIDCIKKTMPMWKEYEELIHFEPMEELDRIDSENKFENLDDLNEKTKKVSYQKYNMISSIIPFISDEELRTTIIKKMADKYDVSVQTIRKYLCTYLSTMNIRSLAPDTRSTKKELSDDEKNIRKSLNKWYFTTKKRTLRNCYTLMLKNYYCDEDGKLLEEYPSFYQFRYFYRNYKKESTEMISRNTLSFYQRNQRPLVGDGVQGFAGTIGLVYLEATVCDLYLVNEAGELIGRPVLTFGVDAFSGLICGYSLSWEGGMYSLRELMLNMISDKVEHCRKFGIEVTEEQWPSHQLPLKIFTDQGSEYKSMNFGQIIDLGVELTNLQSYRAELKGSVEKSFDVIQNYMAPYLKGNGRVEVVFQERGAHDYRKDACLTMNDFEKILLHCIIFYNSKRVMENFRFTEEMLIQEVKPIPCYIWKWAEKNIGSNLIDVDREILMKVLLPRTNGKFTRFGLKVNGLHYKNALYRDAYLKGNECICAYDPDNSNYIYVIENGAYIRFDLIEERFRDRDLDKIEEMKKKQRELVKREQEQKQQAQIDLANNIQMITEMAVSGKRLSTKNIRETRKREQIKTHKNLMRKASGKDE